MYKKSCLFLEVETSWSIEVLSEGEFYHHHECLAMLVKSGTHPSLLWQPLRPVWITCQGTHFKFVQCKHLWYRKVSTISRGLFQIIFFTTSAYFRDFSCFTTVIFTFFPKISAYFRGQHIVEVGLLWRLYGIKTIVNEWIFGDTLYWLIADTVHKTGFCQTIGYSL